jgi:hypothetical protein
MGEGDNGSPTGSSEPVGEPQAFMALPSRGDGASAIYESHLARLLDDLGLQHPALESDNSRGRRSWQLRSARAIGKAIRARPPEEGWFRPLLSAAVLEPDPSHNRFLVEPALAAFGRHRVLAALIEFLATGTNVESAGAANAWYWANLPADYWTGPHTPASDQAVEAELYRQWRKTSLHVFINTNDLGVRQCLISILNLNAEKAPDELRDAVLRAIQIARTHPDHYIRHRVEVQISAS